MPKRKNFPITSSEIKRALYLDFEGPGASSKTAKAPPPVMGGVLCEGEYTWVLLDKAFIRRAEDDGVMFMSLEDFLESLITRARDESRRIVYWTSHEEQLFEEYGFPPKELAYDVFIPVKRHFKEEVKASREAYKKLFSAPKTKKDILRRRAFGLLAHCAAEAGYPRPGSYGAGLIGKWIRYARTYGARKSSYDEWTKAAKTKWTHLLNHNEHDCRATEYLLKHAMRKGWLK